MPSCNATDYKGNVYTWCPKHESENIYSDGNKHYCVFHAPKDQKRMSNEDFSKLVNDRLTKSNNISGTIIPGDIHIGLMSQYSSYSFANVEFYGRVTGGHFNSEVVFDNAKFYANANFKNAIFDNTVSFKSTEFHGYAIFSGATIKKAIFESAKFIEIAFFNDKCTFEKRGNFEKASFYKKAIFEGAHFNDGADFYSQTFNKNEEVNLKGIYIQGQVRFHKVRLENASFQNTDLRLCDFITCRWIEKDGRYILQDEIVMIETQKILSKDHEISNAPTYEDLENLYRNLKQHALENHNHYEYSNWHYSEKEMQRKKLALNPLDMKKLESWRTLFYRLILWVYNCFCGYGENPLKAATLLLITAFLLAPFMIGFAGIEKSTPSSIETLSISLKGDIYFSRLWEIWLTTLEHLTFSKSPEYTPHGQWGRSFMLLFRILVPIQITFFGFSLRNRFRR